jgi:hypothetical protein
VTSQIPSPAPWGVYDYCNSRYTGEWFASEGAALEMAEAIVEDECLFVVGVNSREGDVL